jgi:hypothetical protein
METDSLSDKETFLRSLINDFPELGICVFSKKNLPFFSTLAGAGLEPLTGSTKGGLESAL